VSGVHEFPGFDHLYLIKDPRNFNWLQAECCADQPLSWEDALVRCLIEPDDPVVYKRVWGKSRPADFVWSLGLPLVSRRVLELLRQYSFSGWSTYDARLLGRDGEKIEGYWGLSIAGRCGAIDDDRCVAYLEDFPGGPDMVYRGMYFEPATWDGTDIFMPEGEHYWWIFVTEGVKLALQEAKVRNVSLTPLVDVERPGLDIGTV
jgi:hypothetical protein